MKAMSRRLPCAAILGMALGAIASAGTSGERIVAAGNDNGAPACAGCHGTHGEGNASAGIPRLAGQPAAYLVKQLNDYAKGKRGNAVMKAAAAPLSSADREAVARYYAQQVIPSQNHVKAGEKTLAEGRELAVNGDWRKQVPACLTCHGDGARGVSPHFPALAGQSAGYLQAQLKAWQQGRRGNGPDALMQAVATALSADQTHAVSLYLASLPATGKVPSTAGPDAAPARADAESGYFQPPLRSALPGNQFGAAVRRGERLFTQTRRYATPYVGNALDCANCHLNGGRRAKSAPLWAAWVLYPQYRSKNHKVNTMAERIRGCFTYSENAQAAPEGHAPAGDSRLIADLQSYMFWLAAGAPTGKKMKGQGYPVLSDPAKPFDRRRGAKVYAAHCALCHGDQGQGTKTADTAYAFPPLWGAHAFNWGAGMHRVNTAAGFIKANMPLGRGGSLTAQQAWDVAAYIDSHPRPQDPRFNANLEQTTRQYHPKRKIDYYGKTVDGLTLGAPDTLERWRKKHPSAGPVPIPP